MTLKFYKPTTPGRRGLVLVDRSHIWKGRPEKSLVKGAASTGGRNVHGRITMRHRGGGHRRLYREVDFKRLKDGVVGSVERLEYDPFRTTFLALLNYEDGEKAYILAPEGLKVGDSVVSGESVDIKPGNALPLANIPPGTCVFNVELKVRKGGQLARSAGAFAQIMGREADYTLLRLTSGELRRVLSACRATVGVASNSDNRNVSLAKAGRNRWKGKRPSVRGEAMNPVDHPHGGRTRGGRHPVSPWGTPAKGYKTRHNKRTQQFIIRGRKEK